MDEQYKTANVNIGTPGSDDSSYTDPIVSKLDDQKKQQRRRKLTLLTIAAIAVLAAAGGLIGYFVTRENHSSSAPGSGGSGNTGSGGSGNPGSGSTGGETEGPLPTPMPMPSKQHLIGYFGQNAMANGVDIVKGTNGRSNIDSAAYQQTLAYYCNTGLYDIINLAFLDAFGGANPGFTITFAGFAVGTYGGAYTYAGNGIETNDAETVQGYLAMGSDIQLCQAKGIKVVLSIGGDKISPYSYSVGDGNRYAQMWYDMFLQGNSPVRPFGPGVVLDGIELDIEKNDNPAVWTPEMINMVTTLRRLSPTTLLAAVPQCYLNDAQNKDLNTGDLITATADILDYVIVQYYNNPSCSYPFGFNFNAWKGVYSGKLVVGLAGDWTSAISGGFLPPNELQTVHNQIKSDSQFLGYSVYDVSSSNPPAFSWDVATYANPSATSYSQTLRNVLDGKTVGSVLSASGNAVGTQYVRRCGGTWTHANATCSNLSCSTKAQCGPNQECFDYLVAVC
ncbi:Acidic endochitinase [Podochytrium sp. JEL0797]|nr:Acidic endochitinase [Podochytrium sp. JEL0797]